jgi:hypothetical protein
VCKHSKKREGGMNRNITLQSLLKKKKDYQFQCVQYNPKKETHPVQ